MLNRITELCQTRVSGSISITKGRTERYRAVYSNSNWFDECEWYSIKDDGECLTNFGKFEFDEDESDKDMLVIYYR